MDTTTNQSAAREAGRNFTWADIGEGKYGSIYTDPGELIRRELPWQKAGLSYTATGYGARIPHTHCIRFEGRVYRLYVTCYSNNGSVWFKVKGRTIYVN